MSELIISALPFSAWKDLLRITAEFRDRPGVVHQLLGVLAACHIKVLTEESSSNDNRSVHSIELIVDASGYSASEIGSTPSAERGATMASLERRLLAICVDDLCFNEQGPRLRVRRMKGLHTAWLRFHSQVEPGEPQPIEERSMVEKGEILIPSNVLAALADQVGCRPNAGPNVCQLHAIIVSDTRERLLRVFFPKVTEQLVYVRIDYVDTIEALAAITSTLRQKFDILTGLTRVHRLGRSHFEVLLTLPEDSREPVRRVTATQLRSSLEHLLSVPSLGRFELKISYPSSAAASTTKEIPLAAKRSRGLSKKSQTTCEAAEAELHKQDTRQILAGHIARYTTMLNRPASNHDSWLDQARLTLVRQLLVDEGMPRHALTLFVSYEIRHAHLFHSVQRLARKCGITCLTGDDLGQQQVFRDEIIERIRGADGFLGIWTGRGSDVSPWLHWELAVAQAFKLPFRVLVSEDVDLEMLRRVNPERHHVTFRRTTFQTEAKRVTLFLQTEIRARRQGPKRIYSELNK